MLWKSMEAQALIPEKEVNSIGSILLSTKFLWLSVTKPIIYFTGCLERLF